MNMQLSSSEFGDITANLTGKFDSHSCAQQQSRFEQLCQLTQKKLLVINLEQVSFLDASGIGALVFMFKRQRVSAGRLVIVGAQQQPLQLLQMLRVDHVIPMLENAPADTEWSDSVPPIAA